MFVAAVVDAVITPPEDDGEEAKYSMSSVFENIQEDYRNEFRNTLYGNYRLIVWISRGLHGLSTFPNLAADMGLFRRFLYWRAND